LKLEELGIAKMFTASVRLRADSEGAFLFHEGREL
jgi:hypothetical protein